MTLTTEFPEAHRSGFISRHRKLLIIILFLCFARAIFPGDVPWIQDEPKLISNALRANAEHRLADVGLMGSFGRPYGPIPTWIYQALLLFTHDLPTIVAIRGVGSALLTALGLLLLAEGANLWLGFIPLILLSPWLWIYGRTVWDNSFSIPLAAIALGSDAMFRRYRSRKWLNLTFAMLVIMPFIHLMALAFAAPFAIHLLITTRRILAGSKSNWLIPALLVSAIVASQCQYLWILLRSAAAAPFVFSPSAFRDILDGANHITALGLYHFFDQQWTWGSSPLLGMAFDFLKGPSAVVLYFTVIGGYLSLRSFRYNTLGSVCLSIIAAQLILALFTGATGQPHYFNATWIAFAYLSWHGVSALITRRSTHIAMTIYGLSLLATLVFLISRIHLTAGTRDLTFGTTLAEQTRAAHEINQYPRSTPLMRLPLQTWKFPQALDVLLELNPSPSSRSARSLELRYADPNSWDAHLKVVAH
jgi:hypothetical protein